MEPLEPVWIRHCVQSLHYIHLWIITTLKSSESITPICHDEMFKLALANASRHACFASLKSIRRGSFIWLAVCFKIVDH